MAREFKLPDLGEGITEGQIVRVLCAEGDDISEDQAILEVETDKAAVEIPSPYAGKAAKIHVKEGDTVEVGQVLVTFDGEAGDKEEKKEKKGKKEDKEGKVEKDEKEEKEEEDTDKEKSKEDEKEKTAKKKDRKEEPEEDEESEEKEKRDRERKKSEDREREDEDEPRRKEKAAPEPRTRDEEAEAPRRTRAAAAPAVRKFARERGVDIDSLTGSGPGGRVLQSDVEAAASGRPAAPQRKSAPPAKTFEQIEGETDKDKWGTVKRAKLTQIRKTIARQMVKSASTIPHVTQTDEADVTLLEEIRGGLRDAEQAGPRVTLMSFLVRTLVHCLRRHPIFNARFDDESEQIVYKGYINIGIAVDSPRGLVVPVMRNVEELSVRGIARELGRLAEKVRNVDYSIDELRGGTFTVTNYGAIGGSYGTPIINHPEVAILGVGRTQERLALDGERVVQRQVLPLSLSFDHRAADGAQAARFLNDVVAHLSNPGLLLVE